MNKHCRNSNEGTDFTCVCLSGGWVNGHIPAGEQSAQELVSCDEVHISNTSRFKILIIHNFSKSINQHNNQ